MNEPLLEAEGLSYRYGGREALRGIDLALAPGARVGLVGPNGAGKSTLLLLLAGALEASGGTLWLGGAPVGAARRAEQRRRVGLVFQDADAMLFTTRVHDEVAFGPRQLGCGEAEVEERVQAALQAVRGERFVDEVPQHLSAGQKRAVALAAVLAMRPDALLLDEPTSDLDPRGRRGLQALLEALSPSLLIASHDLEFVVSVCAEVWVLDEGAIVARGPTREILGDAALMEAHGLERPHSLTPHPEAHRH